MKCVPFTVDCVIPLMLIFAQLAVANKWDCVDFYWRDYFGTIPNDAISAGKDSQGHPVYVGLAYIKDYELLPATIYPEQKTAETSAFSHVFNITQNVQILCSPHKEAFEWTSIHSKDLHLYTNQNLVPGGSEVGENLFIGRVIRDNGVIVGKVFRHERDNRGLWFPYKNNPTNSLTYEILEYNCDSVERPKIDHQDIKSLFSV